MEASKNNSYLSRFYVQKKSFLSWSRKILSVFDDRVEIDSIPYRADQKETISYEHLAPLQLSDKNDKEFNMLSNKSKANNTYSCLRRPFLLNEIYKAMDYWNKAAPDSNIYMEVECTIPIEGSKEMEELIRFRIFRTHFQIDFIDIVETAYLNFSREVNDKREESVIHSNDDNSKCNKENNNNNNQPAERPGSFRISYRPTNMSFIFHRGDDMIRTDPECIKPSLIINFSNISSIRRTPVGFTISLRESGYLLDFSTYNIDKTTNIIKRSRANSTAYFRETMFAVEEQLYEAIGVSREESAESWRSGSIHNIVCYRVASSGKYMSKIMLSIDENYLKEISLATEKVINKISLRRIEDIARCDEYFSSISIQLADSQSVTYVFNSFKRDDFLCNLCHILSITSKPLDRLYSDQRAFCKSEFIEGLENESEYEADLLRRIYSAGEKHSDEGRMMTIVKEFNFNANCKTLTDFEMGGEIIDILFRSLSRHLTLYFNSDFQNYLETFYCLKLFNNAREEMISQEFTVEIQNYKKMFGDELTKVSETATLVHDYHGTEFLLNKVNIMNALHNIEEILQMLVTLMNSKVFFRKICFLRENSKNYENCLYYILNLIVSPNQTIAFLSSMLIFKMSVFWKPSSDRFPESQNRSALLRGRTNLILKLSSSLALKCLVNQPFLQETNLLAIFHIIRILEGLLVLRSETLEQEDLINIIDDISKGLLISVFSQITSFHCSPLHLKVTNLINSVFQQLLHLHRDVSPLQALLLNYTPLLPFHLILAFTSHSKPQRQAAVLFLNQSLMNNPSSCSLMARLIPKFLFKRVESSIKDISKWAISDWQDLFTISKINLNTPEEQWNECCREELIKKLEEFIKEFHLKRIPLTDEEALSIEKEELQISRVLTVRCNHEELEVNYEYFKSLYKVYRYFLVKLIDESGKNPILVSKILKPVKFWRLLNTSFLSTEDKLKRVLILKTMILLYSKYSSEIKFADSISYLLSILKKRKFLYLRYLGVQLIYTLLTVEDQDLAKLNIKEFVKSGGLDIMFQILSISNPFKAGTSRPASFKSSRSQYNQIFSEKCSSAIKNFTYLPLDQTEVTDEAGELKNTALIVLSIINYLLSRLKTFDKEGRQLIPTPKAKISSLQGLNIKVLLMVLLFEDDEVKRQALQILSRHYCDPLGFSILRDHHEIFEILVNAMRPGTMSDVLSVVTGYYSRLLENNLSANYVQAYTRFDFDMLPEDVSKTAEDQFPFFLLFPKNMIWRLINKGHSEFEAIYFSDTFEEPTLIWNREMRQLLIDHLEIRLKPFQENIQKYIAVHEVGDLKNIPVYTEVYHDEILQGYRLKEFTCGPIYLRVWCNKKELQIEESHIENFLFLLDAQLFELLNKDFESFGGPCFKELLILVQARSKSIKRYSRCDPSCLDELLAVINFCNDIVINGEDASIKLFKLTRDELKKFILSCLRAINRNIALNEIHNAASFEKRKGFFSIYSSCQALARLASDKSKRKSTVAPLLKQMPSDQASNFKGELSKETQDFLNDSSLDLDIIKSINILLKIFVLLYKNEKQLFFNLTVEEKFTVCLSLQRLSKPALILFELRRLKMNGGENYSYLLKKSIDIANLLAIILLYLSKDPLFIVPMIKAGLPWRALEFCLYYEEEKGSQISSICELYVGFIKNIYIYCNENLNLNFPEETFIMNRLNPNEVAPTIQKSVNSLTFEDKQILLQFFKQSVKTLQERMVWILLNNYNELEALGGRKDCESLLKFLKVLNSTLEEPTMIWNADIKEDFRDLLRKQLATINRTNGESFWEEMSDYSFGTHFNELYFGGVFVRLYNEIPCFRLINPTSFLLSLLEDIVTRIKHLNLGTFDEKPANTNRERIRSAPGFHHSRVFHAVKGILNVLKFHGNEKIILKERNLSVLIELFEKEFLFKDDLAIWGHIKAEVLNIFIFLQESPEISKKILGNPKIIFILLRALRSNKKHENFLVDKIVTFLAILHDNPETAFYVINYGFYFILLEIVFKTEVVVEATREKAFTLFIKILKTVRNNSYYVNMLKVLPAQFLHLINANITAAGFTSALDRTVETPYLLWTSTMRQEIWLIYSKEGNRLENVWEEFAKKANSEVINKEFIIWSGAKLETPRFPDLNNEIIIDDIMLRNYNRKPEICSIKEDEFIEAILKIGSEAILAYDKCLKEIDRLSKSNQKYSLLIKAETERSYSKFMIIISGFLLTLERVIIYKRDADSLDMQALNSNLKEITRKKSDDELEKERIKTISDLSLGSFIKWISLFENTNLHEHIKCSFLQIVLMLLKSEKWFKLFRDNHGIKLIISEFTVLQNNVNKGDSQIDHIKEILLLHIIMKLLLFERKLIFDFESSKTFDNVIKIASSKEKFFLREISLMILGFVVHDIELGEKFQEKINKGKCINLDELIELNPRDYNFDKLWRKPYRSTNELASEKNFITYLVNNEAMILEFPILSEHAYLPIPHFEEENAKVLNEIEKFLRKIEEENIDFAFPPQYNDQARMSSLFGDSPQDQKLPYNMFSILRNEKIK